VITSGRHETELNIDRVAGWSSPFNIEETDGGKSYIIRPPALPNGDGAANGRAKAWGDEESRRLLAIVK
jgi:hypothetical protein